MGLRVNVMGFGLGSRLGLCLFGLLVYLAVWARRKGLEIGFRCLGLVVNGYWA